MIGITIDGIGYAVISDVHHCKNIGTSDRLFDDAFGFTASETGTVAAKKIRIDIVSTVVEIGLAPL